MDDQLSDVREFHLTYGCPVRARPGFYEGKDGYHQFVIAPYMDALTRLGKQLRAEASRQNEAQQTELGALLTRLQLHVEETAELAEAIWAKDIVAALDALADIGYVTDGTHLVLGTADIKREAHDAVHASNMSKLGEDGKPIVDSAGRVVKGPNYRGPEAALEALIYGDDSFQVVPAA